MTSGSGNDLPNRTKVDGSLIEYQVPISIQVCSSCSVRREGELGAIVQTEFGSDPWTAPAFTPAANWTKIGIYNNARLISSSGHAATLTSSWVTDALEANTSAQSVTGDWVAIPSTLANSGASFTTVFVPVSGQHAAQAGPLAPRA